jgi:hypothetical protein
MWFCPNYLQFDASNKLNREDFMSNAAIAPPAYEEDLVLWAEHQAGLIREHRFAQLDIDNLLDELEYIVSSRKNALRSRLRVLLLHLLKCEYQPLLRSTSWVSTIITQRREIEQLIEENPSFQRLLEPFAQMQFRKAVHDAAMETGLPPAVFAPELPYTIEELLDHSFIP